MSPEWRVKSDGRYYRGIRANPDLCDGSATKYVGYFRREKRPWSKSREYQTKLTLSLSHRITFRSLRLLALVTLHPLIVQSVKSIQRSRNISRGTSLSKTFISRVNVLRRFPFARYSSVNIAQISVVRIVR